MIWFKRSSRFLILATALTLGVAVNFPGRVQAKLNSPSSSTQLPELGENTRQTPSAEILVSSSYTPPRPPGGPSPLSTLSGGRRGTCIRKEDGLPIPLIPASRMGQTTVAEYPTISWYLPKTTAEALEFELNDERGQAIYSTSYALAQSDEGFVEPGIMSLTIPPFANIPPLEVGKEYSWKLKVICRQYDSSAIYESKAIPLKRVAIDPTLEARIQQASLKERFALYQEADVWYETLNTMLDLLQKNPNNQELASAWDKLLQSVGR